MALVRENKMIIQKSAFQILVSEMDVKDKEQTKMVETIYRIIELRKCFCFISSESSCFIRCSNCV